MDLRVDEFENYLVDNLSSLVQECAEFCRGEDIPALRLSEDLIYEGCDYCLIRAALEKVRVSTYSMMLRDGSFYELSRFDDSVLEILGDTAELIPIGIFEDHLNDLLSFGLLTDEDADLILQWLGMRKNNLLTQ